MGKREVTILSCGVRPGISAGYGVRLKKGEKVSCGVRPGISAGYGVRLKKGEKVSCDQQI